MSKAEISDELCGRYPALAPLRGKIEAAEKLIADSYRAGGKLLLCGNGGSCADCAHIVGELMKSFKFRRKIDAETAAKLAAAGADFGEKLEGALPAVSLCCHDALITAYSNDTEPELAFAQQVYGYGRSGDVLMAISTSGNSKNCADAAVTARAVGMKVVSLTGEGGGRLLALSDVCVNVPASETFKVQEYHLPVYHCLCAMLEAEFFGEKS